MRTAVSLAFLGAAVCLSLGFGRGEEVAFSIAIPLDDKPDNKMGHVVIEYVVRKSGLAYDGRDVIGWAYQAGRRRDLTEAQLAKATKLVDSLSDSTVTLPKSKTVVLTRRTAEGKKRMVYDRRKLPAQMKELFELLGGLRFEVKDNINFNLEETEQGSADTRPGSL